MQVRGKRLKGVLGPFASPMGEAAVGTTVRIGLFSTVERDNCLEDWNGIRAVADDHGRHQRFAA